MLPKLAISAVILDSLVCLSPRRSRIIAAGGGCGKIRTIGGKDLAWNRYLRLGRVVGPLMCRGEPFDDSMTCLTGEYDWTYIYMLYREPVILQEVGDNLLDAFNGADKLKIE
jgi:hypothetical protein